MELLKYNKLKIGGRLALNNLTGSLCYFNTMLQMLLSTNTTYDILMKYPKYFSKTKVGLALYTFMKEYYEIVENTPFGESIPATSIHRNLFEAFNSECKRLYPKLNFPNGQEDSLEALVKLIECSTIKHEVDNSKAIQNNIDQNDAVNPLAQLFTYKTESNYICECSTEPILSSQDTGIYNYFENPHKEPDDWGKHIIFKKYTVKDFKCSKCSKKSDTKFTTELKLIPENIIVKFNLGDNGGIRRMRAIKPTILIGDLKYKLISSISHHGSNNGGHWSCERVYSTKHQDENDVPHTALFNDGSIENIPNGNLRNNPNILGLLYVYIGKKE